MPVAHAGGGVRLQCASRERKQTGNAPDGDGSGVGLHYEIR